MAAAIRLAMAYETEECDEGVSWFEALAGALNPLIFVTQVLPELITDGVSTGCEDGEFVAPEEEGPPLPAPPTEEEIEEEVRVAEIKKEGRDFKSTHEQLMREYNQKMAEWMKGGQKGPGPKVPGFDEVNARMAED